MKTYEVHLTRDVTETAVVRVMADSLEEALDKAHKHKGLKFERNHCSESNVYDNGAEEV